MVLIPPGRQRAEKALLPIQHFFSSADLTSKLTPSMAEHLPLLVAEVPDTWKPQTPFVRVVP